MSNSLHERLADVLWQAESTASPCPPLSSQQPGLSNEDAYQIQSLVLHRKRQTSAQVGWKIGITSAAVQKWLNIDHPDFGGLFADMEITDGGVASLARLIAPRAEGEVAFVMKKDVRGPHVGAAELLGAIDFVLPAIEIIDTRIADWKITAVDTIADNGSSALFVLGRRPIQLADVDLKLIGMTMRKNGEVVSTGAGAASMGNPVNALLWLVNELGLHGLGLTAGQVVLSGALSEVCIPTAGDHVEVTLGAGYKVEVSFI